MFDRRYCNYEYSSWYRLIGKRNETKGKAGKETKIEFYPTE